MVAKQPSEACTYYPFFDRFLKKRTHPYLINHFRHNPKQDAEKYFYAILLLLRPWREYDTLLGESSNNVEAFNACKTTLLHGLQYHDQLSRLQEAESTVRELIKKPKEKMEKKDMQSTDDVVEGPIQYVANTVNKAMNDFEDLIIHVDPKSIGDMIKKLNSDQARIFEK